MITRPQHTPVSEIDREADSLDRYLDGTLEQRQAQDQMERVREIYVEHFAGPRRYRDKGAEAKLEAEFDRIAAAWLVTSSTMITPTLRALAREGLQDARIAAEPEYLEEHLVGEGIMCFGYVTEMAEQAECEGH